MYLVGIYTYLFRALHFEIVFLKKRIPNYRLVFKQTQHNNFSSQKFSVENMYFFLLILCKLDINKTPHRARDFWLMWHNICLCELCIVHTSFF